jgi:hypothetical protein
MTLRLTTASLVLTITTLMMTGGVHAITREECYEKYRAAKQAGTLKGKTWIDFLKADCGSPAPTPESASTMTAPKAEKKEASPAAPPAAAPLGSAIIPSAVASNSSKVREGKSADFTGAWTTDASACKKVFVKSGARISFTKDSELIGGGLIFQGKEIQGTGANCQIKTTKADGEMTHMILACATTLMRSDEKISFRSVKADEILRMFPNMPGMETKYYRCPM